MLSLEEDIIITNLIFERICDEQDCPFIEIHKLPIAERVKWAHNLSRIEKSIIMKHYKQHRHKIYQI